MKSLFLTPEQYADLRGRYAKFNEPWTPDEVDELRRMAADGVSREDMSTQLGRTPNAVRMKLISLGLYVPKPSSRPWTPADEAALVEQYLGGASFASLAAAFGRTEGAILSRLIRLRAGLRPAPPDGASDVSVGTSDSAPGKAPGAVPGAVSGEAPGETVGETLPAASAVE